MIVLDWSYMCKRCGESVDHLLLHCTIAWSCGLWFSVCLVFNGLCLILFLSYLRLGKESLRDIVTLMFGDQCLIA